MPKITLDRAKSYSDSVKRAAEDLNRALSDAAQAGLVVYFDVNTRYSTHGEVPVVAAEVRIRPDDLIIEEEKD